MTPTDFETAATQPPPADTWYAHDAPSGLFQDDPDLEDTELGGAYDAGPKTAGSM